MTDAVALLAISQVICLGSIAYLYAQLQNMKQRSPRARPVSARVRTIEDEIAVRAPGQMPTPRPRQAQRPMDAAAIAARMQETGLDVPALARRMRKSEEEVRLLLRRQGVLR